MSRTAERADERSKHSIATAQERGLREGGTPQLGRGAIVLLGSAVVLAGIALALSAWFVHRASTREHTSAAELSALKRYSEEASLAAEQLRRERLLAEQSRFPRTAAAPPPVAADSGALRDTAPTPEPSGASAEPPARMITADDVLTTMQSAFEGEARDARWATDTVSKVQALTQKLLSPHSSIESIECRSAMCRLVTAQEDEAHYRQFAGELMHSEICANCFYTKTGTTPDGRSRMTVYIAREGQLLPQAQ